nr:MAG TPA: hypothetical protein [Caudoviricetes sp.]
MEERILWTLRLIFYALCIIIGLLVNLLLFK